MTRVMFTVPGEAKAKARPRVVQGHAYTPKKTIEYENFVKQCYMIYGNKERLVGPVRARIDIFTKIPKSASKKKRMLMLNGKMRPTKKPDCDNIAKAILDSLNDIAYDDDKQAVEVFIRKFYTDEPRTVIILEEIAEEAEKSA